jgi:hypothetical protein
VEVLGAAKLLRVHRTVPTIIQHKISLMLKLRNLAPYQSQKAVFLRKELNINLETKQELDAKVTLKSYI